MDWFKMAANFADHPKVVNLTDRAFRGYITSLCWVARHETDGRYVASGKSPKYAAELVDAGLWESDRPGVYLIHDWLERNPSKGDLDRQRGMARDRMRKKFAQPSREVRTTLRAQEVEVEEELEEETTKARPTDGNPNQPSHDQIYLAERIGDLSAGAIVKLNKAYGRLEVESAMRELHGFPPEERIQSPFAYLEAICRAAS